MPANWNHSASTEDHFRPPMTTEQRQAQSLPENWDLTMGDFSRHRRRARANCRSRSLRRRRHRPSPAATAPTPGGADAGRGGADIRRRGRRRDGRSACPRRDQEHLPFAGDDHSALGKQSTEVRTEPDEALQKIMAPSNGAFMSGTAAFEDAFDDIRCHQMAMLAGVRAAFESLLAALQSRPLRAGSGWRLEAFGFRRQGQVLGEVSREHFEGLSRDPDECFRRLFGDEFARAYEEQLSRLKSARRMQQSKHH